MRNDQASTSNPETKEQRQAQFYAISRDLNDLASASPTKVAQHLFTALVRGTGVQSGYLLLVDRQGWPTYALILTDGRLDEHDTTAPLQHERRLTEWLCRQRHGVLVTDTATDPLWSSWTQGGEGLGAALKVADHSLGALTLIAQQPNHFDEDDLARITNLAHQAAIIIENSLLNARVSQKQKALDVLQQTAHTINSSLSLDQTLYAILDQISQTIRCQGAAVLLREDRHLWLAASTGFADADALASSTFTPTNASTMFRALRQRRTITVSDSRQVADLGLLTLAEPIHAWALTPLTVKGKILGLIILAHQQPYTYGDQSIATLNAFADHVAIAVATHRLTRETDQRLRELDFLNETGQAITSTLDLEHILKLLLERVRDLLQVDAVSIALQDEQTDELVFEAASGEGSVGVMGVRLKPGQGIAGWVAETGKPLVVHDVRRDSRFFSEVDKRTGMTTQAILCVPIVLKGHVVGVIEALNPGQQVSFDKQNVELLNALSGLAATAIDNARLFARVRSAEARYERLFEDSANPIIITDLNGVIIDINRNACSLWGKSKENLQGTNLTHFHSATNTQDFVAPFRHILTNQQTIFNTHILSNNQRLTVEIKGKQVPVKGDTLIQWIGRDVSAEIELEQTREDMVRMIIHDLRNPLANIMNSLDVLGDVVLNNAEDVSPEELLHIATRSGRRMHHLISSILDIGRLELGQAILNTEPTDLIALLNDAMQFIQPQMDIRNISLTANVDPALPQIEIDEDMITRVVLNLLENAIKFTQVGGAVGLTAKTLGPVVEIAIDDNGPGIPPEHQKTIFEKFMRVPHKEKPTGTGLGLTFCRLAVKAHNGNIWVESTPGQGSTFRFTVPIKRQMD